MMFFIHQKGKYTLHKRLHYFSAFTRKALTVLIAVLCIVSLCHGQDAGAAPDSGEEEIRPLKIGEKVPGEFWTKEHLFYINGDTVRKNLKEHKGKPLVLDFWATWCASCIKRFPQLVALDKRHRNEFHILLVNSEKTLDTPETIKSHWNADVNKLKLPTILSDQYITQLYPHYAIPYYIWIDENGRVSAMTSSLFINEKVIESFLAK